MATAENPLSPGNSTATSARRLHTRSLQLARRPWADARDRVGYAALSFASPDFVHRHNRQRHFALAHRNSSKTQPLCSHDNRLDYTSYGTANRGTGPKCSPYPALNESCSRSRQVTPVRPRAMTFPEKFHRPKPVSSWPTADFCRTSTRPATTRSSTADQSG